MAKLNFSIALGLAANNFKQGLQGVQSQLKGFASSVKSCMGMIAGAFAAGQIKAFSQECLQAYSAQIQAEQKLSVIMKQRMNASDEEVKSILKLTAAQQQQGVIGDEVQLAGAQQVATFLKQKDSLNALIPAMNNLLAQQKGLNATQGDAVNIGNLMGKVMTGQTSALKRVGISFDESQEKVLKYGTESEKAATLAQVITDNVGQMNNALAQTDMGKIQQMNNTLGDLKEQIGAAIAPIVSRLAPSIADFATKGADKITQFIDFCSEHFHSLARMVISVFAGIKITKFLGAMSNAVAANNAKIVAAAQVAGHQRKNIEKQITSTIKALRKQETIAANEEGTKQKLAATEVANLRKRLAEQLRTRNKLCEQQIAADAKVAALQTQSAWAKGMAVAKESVASFVTGAKAMLKSFAVTAVISVALEAFMKLYDTLSNTNESFQRLSDTVGKYLTKAFDWLVDKLSIAFQWLDDVDTETGAVSGTFEVLGATIMAVFNGAGFIIKTVITEISTLIKLAGDLSDAFSAIGNANWDGVKKAVGNMGSHLKEAWGVIKKDWGATIGNIANDYTKAFKAFDSSAEAAKKRADEKTKTRAANKAKEDENVSTGGKGKKGTTKKTPAEQAAENVANAEHEYAQTIEKAKQRKEDGLDTEAQYENKVYSALQSLYDAYGDAQAKAPNEKYKQALADTAEKIKEQGKVVTDAEAAEEKAKKTKEEEEEAAKKLADAEKKYAKDMAEIAKQQAKGRDTTFDFENTDSEKVQAQLEFDLDIAQKQLDALKEKAGDDCADAIEQIKAAEDKVEGLDKKLKLSQVEEKVKQLQKSLSQETWQAVQTSWQGIEGIVSDISSLVDTMNDPDATGWEKFCSVIDTAMGLVQTFTSIYQAFNTVQEIAARLSKAKSTEQAIEKGLTQEQITSTVELAAAESTLAAATPVATTSLAAQTVALASGKIALEADTTSVDQLALDEATMAVATPLATAAIGAQAGVVATASAGMAAASAGYLALASALEQEAASAIFAAHASIPFVGPGLAAGFVAMMEGVLDGVKASATATSLSTGGIVGGASPHGDFIPAYLNSNEMVLNTNQQSRLFKLANGGGVANGGNINLQMKVKGRDLVTCAANETSIASKSGKRSGIKI